MLPSSSFEGSVAVVTGGGSGIGLAIAETLGLLGATVAVVGRRIEPLKEAAAGIVAAGGAATTHVGDVRDRAGVEALLAEIESEHGIVTHLVNNAAGNFRAKPEDLSPNAWKAVVDIVLNGTWNWTQTVGRRLIESSTPGSIVSIGTIGAVNGGPFTVHSATAKAGVLAMTKSLASAWGQHGIRINVVTPGPISDTGGAQALIASPEQAQTIIDATPLGRFGTRQEIADATAFLLSDFSAFTTGANLFIDGGSALAKSWDTSEGGDR